MPEVPRRAPGRVDLGQLPPQGVGLPRQGGDEGVNGPGVLDVPEQLAAPAARHVAPVVWGFGIHGGDAPPPPRHGDGGAVPTGQERHAPVGEGESSAPVDGPGHEAEAFEGVDELGRAALGDGQEFVNTLNRMMVQGSTELFASERDPMDSALRITELPIGYRYQPT